MPSSSTTLPSFDDRRATLLLLDGARPDVFLHLAAAGDLPHLSRHFLDPGGVVPATTVFPSTTGVAYLPFLTGCYPGTCDIPGIRWLNRATYNGRWWAEREHVRSYCGYQGGMLNDDLRPGIDSIYDIVDDTVVLASPFTRGLDRKSNRVRAARALLGSTGHYTGKYESLDRAVGRELCRLAGEQHKLVFAVFPAVDGVTHFYDPWHPSVLATYRQFDDIIGAYAAAGGFDGDHLALVVSDHGASAVSHHTDVAVSLDNKGIPTLAHPVIWRKDPAAAVMVSGNGSAQVYLAPVDGPKERVSLSAIESGSVPGIPADTVDYLAALPGVAFVAATDSGGVTAVSAGGRSTLTKGENSEIAYQSGAADVLALGGDAQHDERSWLGLTHDGAYPDAPAQLLQLFRSARAGDLVVVAESGSDLRGAWEVPEHRSGHGSLIKDHMQCLVAANRRLAGPLRTVDIFPLLLRHLGHSTPSDIDGIWTPSEPS
jgi:hypothetical protein